MQKIIRAYRGNKLVYSSVFSIDADLTDIAKSWRQSGFRVFIRRGHVCKTATGKFMGTTI